MVDGCSGMRSVSTVVVSLAARGAIVPVPISRSGTNAAASSVALVSSPATATSNASIVVTCGTWESVRR